MLKLLTLKIYEVALGMDASMIAEMKSLVEENRRLKKMYAEVQLSNEIIKEALEKKW